eukprot:a841028_1370.p1 GENE.a841028_1370~~a841028_1370.p1  ORF type:complete len:551 (-),score=304.09 a841028_1370:15-1637(-)
MSDHEVDYDDVYDYDYDQYDEDEEFENSEKAIPEKVKAFLLHFQRALREGSMLEINDLYVNKFISLTETFFSAAPWPEVSAVSELVQNDEVFLKFYREIYYRHIYATLQPTLEQRFASYNAYRDLFGYLLATKSVSELPAGVLQIPPAWFWDIIDEFIYQFQSFCQFRLKARSLSDDERAMLIANPDVWSVKEVFSSLHELMAKANIHAVLDRERADMDLVLSTSEPGFEFGAANVYKMLGYFSLVGLLRLNVLLGDYHGALAVLDPVDISDKKAYYVLVTACHMSLFYYLGFAYVMLGRYVDAVNAWSDALVYITRTKQFHTRSYQYNQIEKMNEQMYAMLAITNALCPQRLDESLVAKLQKEHADRIARMQRGDMAAFEEAFQRACPKFITPAPLRPSALFGPEDSTHKHGAVFASQLALFLRDVTHQLVIPRVRSYLKLYTSISVAKLASFLGMPEQELRVCLVHYKHKTRSLVWDDEDAAVVRRGPLTGKLASMSDVAFHVDGDMIYVADTKVARRYGEYFMQHIQRLESLAAARK